MPMMKLAETAISLFLLLTPRLLIRVITVNAKVTTFYVTLKGLISTWDCNTGGRTVPFTSLQLFPMRSDVKKFLSPDACKNSLK